MLGVAYSGASVRIIIKDKLITSIYYYNNIIVIMYINVIIRV